MKNLTTILTAFVLMYSVAHAQTPNIEEIKWQEGPSIGNLSGTAEVRIPAGYVFADANDTRILMEAMQNPTSGKEMGFIAPAARRQPGRMTSAGHKKGAPAPRLGQQGDGTGAKQRAAHPDWL